LDGEFIGVFLMQDKTVNYEKIGLYVSLVVLFFTLMLFLYQIKDDAGISKERIRALEVKVEKLENNKN
jgi:hypothetical protein